VPSKRSWLERTIGATPPSAGAARRIRSPTSVCWRMKPSAPVAEPGERVRRRLALGLAQQPQVLGEAGGHARQHEHQGRDRQRGGPLAHRLDPPRDQDAERERAGGARRDQAGEPPGANPRRGRGGLPGAEPDHERAERPQHGGRRRGELQPGGRLVEEERVGQRAQREPDGKPRERAAGPPAREHERGAGDPEQQQVADQVAEVDRERAGELGGVGHRLPRHGDRDRGDRQRGQQAVEPQRATPGGEAAADQQDQRGVGRGIEGEPQQVRDGRDRPVGAAQRSSGVAARPREHAGGRDRHASRSRREATARAAASTPPTATSTGYRTGSAKAVTASPQSAGASACTR